MENQDIVLDSGFSDTTSRVDEQKIISLDKFIILSILSFGMYEVWWMYKSWRFFKQKENLDIQPAGRALFGIFLLGALMNKILNFAKEKDYQNNYSTAALFIGFLVLSLMAYLPDPYWLISMLSFLFLVSPFEALNYAKRQSTEFKVTEQTSFNTRQIILMIAGALIWLFALIGLAS